MRTHTVKVAWMMFLGFILLGSASLVVRSSEKASWSLESVMNRTIRLKAMAPMKSGHMLALPQAATQYPHSMHCSSS